MRLIMQILIAWEKADPDTRKAALEHLQDGVAKKEAMEAKRCA